MHSFYRCKYIPVRRKCSAGLRLVISPLDKIFVYTAMYEGSIRQSVTGPYIAAAMFLHPSRETKIRYHDEKIKGLNITEIPMVA